MSDWVAVKEYAALFLAELDKQMIEQSGIPVMLKGPLETPVGGEHGKRFGDRDSD